MTRLPSSGTPSARKAAPASTNAKPNTNDRARSAVNSAAADKRADDERTNDENEPAVRVTARPMRVAEKQANQRDRGAGLSIDADQLGEQFLRDATEQGDSIEGAVPELSIRGPAASDTAREGAGGRDGNIWDLTVGGALASAPEKGKA